MGTKTLNDIKEGNDREIPQADKARMKLSFWDKKREVYKHIDADISAKENGMPMATLIAKNNGYETVEELFYYEALVPPNNKINTWQKFRNMKLSEEEFDELQEIREEERAQRAKHKDDDGDDDESYRKKKK